MSSDPQDVRDVRLSLPSDLTDEALAALNQLHDICHPARPGGVFDPERNPGGCDKQFCCTILLEVPATVEPAIRADERRKCADEIRAEARRTSEIETMPAFQRHLATTAMLDAADIIDPPLLGSKGSR
jgi:hypothetical protein